MIITNIRSLHFNLWVVGSTLKLPIIKNAGRDVGQALIVNVIKLFIDYQQLAVNTRDKDDK